jgi:hypothetical protein
MGKIVISTNMTLDGVIQDPDGEEGFSRGGWFVRHGGKDLAGREDPAPVPETPRVRALSPCCPDAGSDMMRISTD